MNIFQITSPAKLHEGLLILNEDQARRRNHLLVKQSAKVKSFKLDADELAFITPEKGELAVYKLIGDTMFKAGERIGYDGELNKAMAALLKPVSEVENATAEALEEAEPDPTLVMAIAELDPNNSAHFNTHGKPELKILEGLLKRKVTGKERDAAHAYYQAHGAPDSQELEATIADDLLEALTMLDDNDDDSYEEDGTPKLAVISNLVGREVTADELEAALTVIEAQQDIAD